MRTRPRSPRREATFVGSSHAYALALALTLAACGGGAPEPETPAATPASMLGAAPKPVALPGACMSPDREVRKGLTPAAAVDPTLFRTALEDLDGDHVADKLVAGGLGNVDKTWVFVTRGACGHLVAAIDGTVVPKATQTNGLRDLAVEEPSPDPDEEDAPPRRYTARFDGTAYKPAP